VAVAHFTPLLPLQQPQQPCSSLSTTSISSHRTSKQQQQQWQPHHHPRRGSTTVCSAAAGDAGEASSRLSAALAGLAAGADATYRFTRPHTMLGTLVSIVSVSLLAMQSFAWSGPAATGLLQALLPALLMNVAIVGINQIYDVEIDKVNKPYLPLASGELSMQQGARACACVCGGGGVCERGESSHCTVWRVCCTSSLSRRAARCVAHSTLLALQQQQQQ
jgi:hypothetical protein